MNERTFTKTALAAATFLAVSTFAFAQTSGQAATTGGGQTGTSAQTGQTGAAGGAQPSGTAAQQPGMATTPSGTTQGAMPGQTTGTARMPTRSDNAQSAFKMLDSANRGYVTREEMDRLSGFSGFDAADSNRDGRLSNEEFSKAWGTYGTTK